MLGKLRLGLCVLLVLAPVVAGSLALTRTERALIQESNRLAGERAASLATRASLTLDAMFIESDVKIASAGNAPIDPSALADSHPSISSVAVFDPSGFQIDRWPKGSVSLLRPPQPQGVTTMRGNRILRTSQTGDGRTIAMLVSLRELAMSKGGESRVSLQEDGPTSDSRSDELSHQVAGYPLVATAKMVPTSTGPSLGWLALALLGMAVYGFLLWSAQVTSRRREESLRRSNRELKDEVNQVQSSFLSSVAKELWNPLSHVLGLTGTLAGRWEDLSDEKKRLLVDRIGANAEAMDEMVEEMMDFARIQEGKRKLFPRVLGLQMECEGVLDKLKPTLRAHRAVSMIPEDLTVVADCRALRRVLEILLSNAVRFSPKGTLIMLRAHRSGDEVVISVDDESASIPSEDVERVFDRFYKRDDERCGPGVGLWIAKDFVTSMDGQIRVETSDRGNTFTFNLPATLTYVTLPPDDVLVSRELS